MKDDFFDQLSCDTLERLHLQEEGGECLEKDKQFGFVSGGRQCRATRWSGCTCRRRAVSCADLLCCLQSVAFQETQCKRVHLQETWAARAGCT